MLKEYDQAIKHHTARLKIAEGLGDKVGQFRALGNLCQAAKAQGKLPLAREYWAKQQEMQPQEGHAAGRGGTPSSVPARRSGKQGAPSGTPGPSHTRARKDDVGAKTVTPAAPASAGPAQGSSKPSSWADLIPENIVIADLPPLPENAENATRCVEDDGADEAGGPPNPTGSSDKADAARTADPDESVVLTDTSNRDGTIQGPEDKCGSPAPRPGSSSHASTTAANLTTKRAHRTSESADRPLCVGDSSSDDEDTAIVRPACSPGARLSAGPGLPGYPAVASFSPPRRGASVRGTGGYGAPTAVPEEESTPAAPVASRSGYHVPAAMSLEDFM